MSKKKQVSKYSTKVDKYVLTGKDPELTYNLVGPKRMAEFQAQGWNICKKQDHPNLVLAGDIRKEEKEGTFNLYSYTLMYAPVELADVRKAENEERNVIQDSKTIGDTGSIRRQTIRNE